MDDLEKRVKVLEDKVKILEETLETLKNMSLSDQMEGYIKKQTKTLNMVNLINSISDEPSLDFSNEQKSLHDITQKKKQLDSNIRSSLQNATTLSVAVPDDPKLFNYEIESGVGTDNHGHATRNNHLEKYIGQGIRITAYNGFDANKIIIPSEIDKKPVISIGPGAFMNTSITEVTVPESIKVICEDAFKGCKNLKYVSLPKSLEVIEEFAFFMTAIGTIIIPKEVKSISNRAFGVSEPIYGSNVTCVFLGKETSIDKPAPGSFESRHYNKFYNIKMIYCLPGSEVQQVARMEAIPMKPLSEFRMENLNE